MPDREVPLVRQVAHLLERYGWDTVRDRPGLFHAPADPHGTGVLVQLRPDVPGSQPEHPVTVSLPSPNRAGSSLHVGRDVGPDTVMMIVQAAAATLSARRGIRRPGKATPVGG